MNNKLSFQENVDDGVSLVLSEARVSPSALTFDYLVTNGSPYRIYLLNQLFHRRGVAGFQVDNNLVYVGVDPGPIVHLRKQLIGVPEDLDVEAPEVPYVTPLEKGRSFSETIHLEFPIRPYMPYVYGTSVQTSYVVNQFTFTLGYILEDEPIRASEVILPSGTTHLRIGYTDLIRRQRLKVTSPITAEIAMLG